MSKHQRPRILITGAAGALAQQVIRRLRESCDLVAVDFREQVYLGDDIPSYCIDFNKRVFEDLFRRYEFDGVIHLGRILSSQLTRMRRYNANVLGTQKLLDLSHKYGIRRVIVLSTYHVYGAVAYNPALIDESAPLKSAGLSADLVDSVELDPTGLGSRPRDPRRPASPHPPPSAAPPRARPVGSLGEGSPADAWEGRRWRGPQRTARPVWRARVQTERRRGEGRGWPAPGKIF